MEQEKRTTYTVIAIVALITLVLGCMIGAVSGGVTGFLVGRRQARIVTERAVQGELEDLPGPSEEIEEQWREEYVPLPGPRGRMGQHWRISPGVEGALIVEVIEGTPADQAGLETGDIIVRIDRTTVDQQHELPGVLEGYRPGDVVTVHILRAGREDSVRVKLVEHPQESGRAYLGVGFETLTGEPQFGSPRD